MLKRFLTLFLSALFIIASAVGFVSCKVGETSDLTVLTDVKGIPDKAEDALDKNDNGGANGSVDAGNDEKNESENDSGTSSEGDIILNTSSKKIHLSSECGYASSMKESNKLVKPRSELESYLENGYSVCSNCNKKYQIDD